MVGLLVVTMGYAFWLIPYDINIGGFGGLSLILNVSANVPYLLSSMLLNAGLFIYAWKKKGKRFVFKSIVATFALNALLDVIAAMDKPMWGLALAESALLGSVVAGIGFGLVLKGGFTTGGSDCLGEILHSLFPKFSTGLIMTAFDLIVITISGITQGFDNYLLWLVAMFASNLALDTVLYFDRISDHPLGKLVKRIYVIVGRHDSDDDTIITGGLTGTA